MKRHSLALAIAALLAIPSAFADNKACELASPEELQAALGAKPGTPKGTTSPSGVEICTVRVGSSTVNVRLYAKKDSAEQEKEDARLDALKKAGATVETRRVTGFNCLELRPGGKAARQPYTTSCATNPTSKAPRYAVIEVTNPSQSFEMKQVAPLAQSIAARLF